MGVYLMVLNTLAIRTLRIRCVSMVRIVLVPMMLLLLFTSPTTFGTDQKRDLCIDAVLTAKRFLVLEDKPKSPVC